LLPDIELADIGSGAGFPGIPLSINNLNRPCKLIDADHRKAVFLKESIRTLNLPNTTGLSGRFQDLDLTGMIWTQRALEKLDINLNSFFTTPQPKQIVLFIGDTLRDKLMSFGSEGWSISFEPVPVSKNRHLAVANRR
jgi:16S rRNA G527 N7-methylase RsmG